MYTICPGIVDLEVEVTSVRFTALKTPVHLEDTLPPCVEAAQVVIHGTEMLGCAFFFLGASVYAYNTILIVFAAKRRLTTH